MQNQLSHYFFILLLCFSFNPPSIAQDKPAIRYSGAANWYPIFPVNKDNLMLPNEGVGIELMNEISKRLGAKVELKADIPWIRQWYMLDNGTLDIIVGAGMTDDRKAKYIQTEAFMESDFRLFVKVGKAFTFDQLKDLQGITLAITRGAKFGDQFDKFIVDPVNKITIYEVPHGKLNTFKMLDRERVDMVPMDYYDGTYSAKTLGFAGKFVALPKSIGKSPIYAYISKKSPWAPFADQISETIKDMKQDGTMDKILMKY